MAATLFAHAHCCVTQLLEAIAAARSERSCFERGLSRNMASCRQILVSLEDGRKKMLSLHQNNEKSDVESLTVIIKKEFKLANGDNIVIQRFEHGWINDYMDIEDNTIIANQEKLKVIILPGRPSAEIISAEPYSEAMTSEVYNIK